jgi:bacillithiol synthase
MEILNLNLPTTNRFASGYLQQDPDTMSFFHYRYGDIDSDKKRLEELSKRNFPRELLANHIERFMSRYPTSSKVSESLLKFKNPDSVVVIGGQQAGILTGPLYSIHKVISIIKLAEEKEKLLNVPVIPVFWIAGEDHDYQEVNHVYLPNGQNLVKQVYPDKITNKKMVSNIGINQELCQKWTEEIIGILGEAEFTHEIQDFIQTAISHSRNFVDFFAYIIMELFKDKGILLLDSGNADLRKMEAEFFLQFIDRHKEITNGLFTQQEEIASKEFPLTIESARNSANLFYYEEKYNERLLLEYNDETQLFTDKRNYVAFTIKELKQMASEYPERLSNNVVTRPLMQEMLFPTLAFIAGPGEIAYWGELKKVFELFDVKMPPIVPRLNITLLERAVESDILDLELTIEGVLLSGTTSAVDRFFTSVKDAEIAEQFLKMKEHVSEQYKIIEQKLAGLDKGLLQLLSKNEAKLREQIDFMQAKIDQSVQLKHANTFQKFNRIENSLRPNGGPQERTYNAFYFLNKYGFTLIKELLELPLEFDGKHKVVKL